MQAHARVQEIIASRRRTAEPAPEVEPELFARVDQPRRVPLGEDEHVAFKVQGGQLSKAEVKTFRAYDADSDENNAALRDGDWSAYQATVEKMDAILRSRGRRSGRRCSSSGRRNVVCGAGAAYSRCRGAGL
jgi:hypothetical protein